MGFIIFLILMLVPIIEIIGFIQVGSMIGMWATLAVVILTAIVGSILLRYQGMAVMFRAQEDLRRGVMPVDQMITGMFLAFAGALLLTPGFFTDILGLLLFLPPFRQFVMGSVLKGFIQPRAKASFDEQPAHQPGAGRQEAADEGDGPIIDGTYSEVNPDDAADARRGQDEPKGERPGGVKRRDGRDTPWARD